MFYQVGGGNADSGHCPLRLGERASALLLSRVFVDSLERKHTVGRGLFGGFVYLSQGQVG